MTPPLRILGLEGASNFRDFGGYALADGTRVRWRHLFRSNKLSTLSPTDHRHLDCLGLTTIFDLRAPAEQRADPTNWSHPALNVLSYPLGMKRRLVDMALEYAPDQTGVRALMIDFYAEMPRTMAHVFEAVIRAIAEGAHPCVIHCSAGKDRTGLAVALVLAALGVDRETIVDDYLLTQALRRPDADMARAIAPDLNPDTVLARYSPEAIAVMRAASADYLLAAFAAIERAHGSVEGYLEEGLALEPAVLARLRDRLLEQGRGEDEYESDHFTERGRA